MLFVLFFGGEIIEVFFQFGYTFISLIVVLHFFFNNVFFTDSFFLFVMLFRSLEVFLSCASWFFFYKGTSFALLGSAVSFVVV
jgi:hypothetical protein